MLTDSIVTKQQSIPVLGHPWTSDFVHHRNTRKTHPHFLLPSPPTNNKYKCKYYGSETVVHRASQWQLHALDRLLGSRCNSECTRVHHSHHFKMWPHQSTYIYLKNNPAKFHPDPIWNDGALRFFEAPLPNKNKKNNNNNNNNKMGSVPGAKKSWITVIIIIINASIT